MFSRTCLSRFKLEAVNKPTTVSCFARKISGANADLITTSTLSYCRAGEQGCREMSLQENRAWTICFKNSAANWAIMSGLFLRLNDNKTIFLSQSIIISRKYPTLTIKNLSVKRNAQEINSRFLLSGHYEQNKSESFECTMEEIPRSSILAEKSGP